MRTRSLIHIFICLTYFGCVFGLFGCNRSAPELNRNEKVTIAQTNPTPQLSAEPSPTPEVSPVTARELYRRYEENPTKAQSRYGYKYVPIVGEIRGIERKSVEGLASLEPATVYFKLGREREKSERAPCEQKNTSTLLDAATKNPTGVLCFMSRDTDLIKCGTSQEATLVGQVMGKRGENVVVFDCYVLSVKSLNK
jgi:hypothetical protein